MARRFHFRLETLLRVRELREREARRRVAVKAAEIERLDGLNRETAEEILRRQAQLRRVLERPALNPVEVIRERAWIAHLRRGALERSALRARLADELAQLQRQLRDAHVQTRVLQKLRERRWDEHRRAEQQREQAESDELARNVHRMGCATAAGG